MTLSVMAATLGGQDADFPGQSLIGLATSDDDTERVIMSEYHALYSTAGVFMVRVGKWKYIYHVDLPPMLFNLDDDPNETADLADDPAYAPVLQQCHAQLETICDPIAVDARAKAMQAAELERRGGLEKLLAQAGASTFTPAPAVK